MISRELHRRRNWLLIGEATTAPLSMMGALLDASGAPHRTSRDGTGRWVHRRELRRAVRLRGRLERAVAAGTPLDEAARGLGLSPETAFRLIDGGRDWS